MIAAADLTLMFGGSSEAAHRRLGSESEATEWANRVAANMPLEKKVAQLVFIEGVRRVYHGRRRKTAGVG